MTRQTKIPFPLTAAVVASLAVGPVASAQDAQRRAPTAADWAAVAKLPDFTGVWEVAMGAPRQGNGRGANQNPQPGSRGGDAVGGPQRGSRGVEPGRGLSAVRPQGPSLTAEAAAKRSAFLANAPEDSPAANCVPPGMPGIMGQPYPMEFLLTPGQVTIVIEAYTQVRHIYTDGRSLPSDPDPKFHGTSAGRWEGDTLVVDTVGFSPLTELERGVPHSDKMRIVERFKLSDPDTMTIETTVNDPEVLTAAYTTTRTLKRHRSWTIAEYVCQENNRNFVDDKGKAGVNLK